MSNEKMAKSQGNIIKIKDFREGNVSGQVIRFALMSAHYKQPLDWNDKLLKDCQNTLDKWYKIYDQKFETINITDEIISPLYEDLNTPGYIANLHKLYDSAVNGSEDDKKTFITACKFVGFLTETEEEWVSYKKKMFLYLKRKLRKRLMIEIKQEMKKTIRKLMKSEMNF